jgi:hypothetical protein
MTRRVLGALLIAGVGMFGAACGGNGTSYGDHDPAFVLAAIDNGGTSGMSDAMVDPYAADLRHVARLCEMTEKEAADQVAYVRQLVRERGGEELRVGAILDSLVETADAWGAQLGGKDGCEATLAAQATLTIGDS